MIQKRLHQRAQQQFLVRAMRQPLDAGEVEVVVVNVRLGDAADLVLVGAGGADDRGGVTVEQVGPQQHEVAELERPHQTVIAQQRHRRAHVRLGTGLFGQRLLQPLGQFGEAQQPDILLVAHGHDSVLDFGQRRGVRVHGSLSQGICRAMSCLSFDG